VNLPKRNSLTAAAIYRWIAVHMNTAAPKGAVAEVDAGVVQAISLNEKETKLKFSRLPIKSK
jgi:hypothetical protein